MHEFHKEDLDELVRIACYALEQEDRYITGCTRVMNKLYGEDGKPPGILRFLNERFYQYVMVRALMSKYKFKIDLEKETYDIVLLSRESIAPKKYIAVGEMKKWMSTKGETDIPKIKKDIDKLSVAPNAASFLIILTAWDPKDKEKNIAFLVNQLSLNEENLAGPYTFPTIGWPKAPIRDFAVLGYLVNP